MFVTNSMSKRRSCPGYLEERISIKSILVFSPLELCCPLNCVPRQPDIIMQVAIDDLTWPDSILTTFSALFFPAIYQKRKIVNSLKSEAEFVELCGLSE